MKNKLLRLLAVALCLGTLCVPLLGAATIGASSGELTSDSGESPACVCEVKCAVDTVNGACLICAADPTACKGKDPIPPCTCEVKCAEGAVNGACPALSLIHI